MNKLEQAARQALEALKKARGMIGYPANMVLYGEELTLREALAEQAKQEPVGYFAYDEEHDIWEELTGPNAPGATKLYAAPVRTKDLTDDEIADIVYEMNGNEPTAPFWRDLARAVIAADREKNK